MINIVKKPLLALVICTLYACGGGGSSGRSAPQPSSPGGPAVATVSISGAISFDRVHPRSSGNGLDYNNITVEPARGVTVELINSAGAVHSATVSNSAGEYELQASVNSNLRLQVKAELKSDAWNVRVTDNTAGNALYLIRGSLVASGNSDSIRNLHAPSGWNASVSNYTEPRSAAPFAIADVIYEAMQAVTRIDPAVVFPPLELRWSTANTTASGDLTEGDIGTSFYTHADSAIYLVGSANNDTDEYDSHVIAHEWGHYLEDKLSKSDSIGGPHGSGDRLDMRVSFSEGFAYALAAILLQDSRVRDSFGQAQGSGFSFDVESNQTLNPGWYSEASVQSILYDIADSDADGVDQIATGLAAIYQVMASDAYRSSSALASLYLFISELNRQFPQHRENVDALVMNQAISGRDKWGAGETNDGGESSVLPVYRQANIAVTQSLCTSSEFNSVLEPSVNKLGNSVFVRYADLTSGTYTISVEPLPGATRTNPVLTLYRNGQYVFDLVGNAVGIISWSGSLTGGEYVLILSEADATASCYNLVFSNN